MNIEQLAYLKTPDKIRAALINTTGSAPSLYAIERRLSTLAKTPTRSVPEPLDRDAIDYVAPWILRREQKRKEREERLAKAVEEVKKPNPLPMVPFKHNGTPQSHKLVEFVCKTLGLDACDFYGPTRLKEYVHARSIVAKVLRERNPSIYSYPKIGTCVGRSDHSTVINLLRNFETYCRYPHIWETYQAAKALAL